MTIVVAGVAVVTVVVLVAVTVIGSYSSSSQSPNIIAFIGNGFGSLCAVLVEAGQSWCCALVLPWRRGRIDTLRQCSVL